jgi:hypothetical protein
VSFLRLVIKGRKYFFLQTDFGIDFFMTQVSALPSYPSDCHVHQCDLPH